MINRIANILISNIRFLKNSDFAMNNTNGIKQELE